MANFTVNGGVIDSIRLTDMLGLPIVTATGFELKLQSDAFAAGTLYHPLTVDFGGAGFVYDSNAQLVGGTIQGLSWQVRTASGATPVFVGDVTVDGLNIPVSTANVWFATGDTTTALNTIFGGDDVGRGLPNGDLIRGFAGNDTLSGEEGYDTIYGGLGDDVIYSRNATNSGGYASAPGTTDPNEKSYLRGDEGNDTISGGLGFDDINGNMGNDLAHGNAGDDWLVGGKDDDRLFGDDGGDVVWGNLGNDTLDGGDGADQVRGGQGDDVLTGGAGNDYVSGDRGADTISGGAGADLFHSSQDAGIDRVLDFSVAEGDRVMLDPGTTYTLRQSGADTVIDFGGGHQMILVGVDMATLAPGTIFLG